MSTHAIQLRNRASLLFGLLDTPDTATTLRTLEQARALTTRADVPSVVAGQIRAAAVDYIGHHVQHHDTAVRVLAATDDLHKSVLGAVRTVAGELQRVAERLEEADAALRDAEGPTDRLF